MLAEQYKNCKVKTTSISSIVNLINDLLLNHCIPIVIINLNQCLFQINDNLDGYKIYDPEFRNLCSIMFKNYPNNLIFITSDYSQFQISNNAFLNSLDIVSDLTFHRYNIIHTGNRPYSEAVKKKLQLYSLANYGNPYVFYIDTNDHRIDEFENVIDDERVNYIFIKISKPEYTYIPRFLFRKNDFEICERYMPIREKLSATKIDYFSKRSKVLPESRNDQKTTSINDLTLYCDEV